MIANWSLGAGEADYDPYRAGGNAALGGLDEWSQLIAGFPSPAYAPPRRGSLRPRRRRRAGDRGEPRRIDRRIVRDGVRLLSDHRPDETSQLRQLFAGRADRHHRTDDRPASPPLL